MAFSSPMCVQPSYGTFISGFTKKRLAGPYRSYDKCDYVPYDPIRPNNPLRPSSEQFQISRCSNNALLRRKVIRIKMIAQDEFS